MSREQETRSAEELFEEYRKSGTDDFQAFLSEHSDQAEELESLKAWFDAQQEETGDQEVDVTETVFRRRLDRDESGTTFLREGQVLGEFQLIQQLGRGGMGEVWEAEQSSLGRRVAFKALLPGQIDQRGLEFFEREARAGARLNHAGIVSVLGTGHDEGVYWIAMELVEGGCTLADFIEDVRSQSALPPDYYSKVADFAARMVDALAASHEAGVIHRDLKPANVLITPNDEPKIGDFGLARVVDEHGVSITGDFAGTYAYMSPEQVMARRMGIDHRSDVFSMGVVLYELLALRRPFEGDTTHQIAEQIIFQEPPDPRTIRSKAPTDLVVICGKAMEKQRGQRYQSMEEFAADLRRHLANEPIHAKPPSPVQRAVKWVRRNPTKSGVGAVSSMAFVVIAWLFIQVSNQNDLLSVANMEAAAEKERAMGAEASAVIDRDLAIAAEQEADRERDNALAAKEEAAAERDNALAAKEEAAVDRDLAVAAQRKADEERDRALDAEEMAARQSYSAFLHAARAAFMREEYDEAKNLHASCPEAQRGWEWDHLGLQLDQSLSVMEGYVAHPVRGTWGVRDIDISPDGTKIAVGLQGSSQTVVIKDAKSGELIHVLSHGEIDQQVSIRVFTASVAFSPDGTRLASGGFDPIVYIWDVDTGSLLNTLEGHTEWISCVAWSPDGERLVSTSHDLTARVWSAETGEELLVLKGHKSGLSAAIFASGDRILTSNSGGTLTFTLGGGSSRSGIGPDSSILTLWDAVTGEPLWETLFGKEGWPNRGVSNLALSPGGEVAAITFEMSEEVCTVALETGELSRLTALKTKFGRVSDLTYSPDGSQLALVTGQDQNLHLLRTVDGVTVSSQAGHREAPICVKFHPDGTRVLTGSKDGEVRTWSTDESLRSWRPPDVDVALASISGYGGPALFVFALCADESRFVTNFGDSDLRIRDIERPWIQRTLKGHSAKVSCVAYSRDGSRIVSGAIDHVVYVWNAETGDRLLALEGHTEWVSSVAFSPDGERILSTSHDLSIRVWDAETGDLLMTLGEGVLMGGVNAAVFSPDGERIISIHSKDVKEIRLHGGSSTRSAKKTEETDVRIWDAATGDELQSIKSLNFVFEPTALTLTRDGARAFVGYERGHVQLYDLTTSEVLQSFQGHSGAVHSIALSPAEDRLLTSCSDIRIWDIQTGQTIFVLKEYPSNSSAVFSSDGSRIITSDSYSGIPRIWESDQENSRRRWYLTRLAVETRDYVQGLFRERAGYSPLEMEAAVRAAINANDSLTPEAREVADSILVELSEHYIENQIENDLAILFKEHLLEEQVTSIVQASDDYPLKYKGMLLEAVKEHGNASAIKLNNAAWNLVNPDREDKGTDIVKGLRLVRVAVETNPSYAPARDTLAWALLANGHFEEAVVVSEEALELVTSESDKENYQGYLERIQAEVSKARSAPVEETE